MGTLRHPRAWLNCAAGSFLLTEADITVHRYQSSDSFSAVFPMDQPGAAALASMSPIPATITGSNDSISGGGGVELIKGYIDQPEFLFHERMIRVNGRDRTAELLDKQSKEKWQDRSASDIVQEIAGRHGFSTQIDSTSDKAGKQYTEQHDFISDLESEWSVIVALAEREGKVAYVKGDTLYFVAPGNQDAEGGAYLITYTPPTPADHASSNTAVQITCLRNVPMARPVKVNVRSFDRRQKKVIEGKKEAGGQGDPVEYNYNVPGLTQQEADAIADKKLSENTAFEKVVNIHAPGDVNIDPRMMLILTGTGTAFDQSYFIDSIRHHFSADDRYTMDVQAKNKASGR